jgi:hypothetical protein
MRAFILALAVSAAAMGAALAHPATEQYIPIGQSPGALTMQGEVSQPVAPAAANGETSVAMTAAGATGDVAYVVGASTRIYLDRSAQGRPNTVGSLADLQPGRAIEVCIPDASSRVADWIKVRTPE